MKARTYVCRKMRLYYYLVEHGYKPYMHAPDKYNPNRLVWLYWDSPELQDAITEYYSLIPKAE